MEQMFTGGVAFGGTFNGNPLSLAGADVCLTELARDNGAALQHAKRMGEMLMSGILRMAAQSGLPLQVTGFGTAFTLHFTGREQLRDYRDTFDDDQMLLRRFLHGALSAGVNLVPDGRFYVSAAHSQRDIEETLEKLAPVLENLK
jgi:glutamate-1-semialdehyde 2,1-aminomutase